MVRNDGECLFEYLHSMLFELDGEAPLRESVSADNLMLYDELVRLNGWLREFRSLAHAMLAGDLEGMSPSCYNPICTELLRLRGEMLEQKNRAERGEAGAFEPLPPRSLDESTDLLCSLTDNMLEWIVVLESTGRETLFLNQSARNAFELNKTLAQYLTEKLAAYNATEYFRVWEIECKAQDVDMPYPVSFRVQTFNTVWRGREACAHIIVDITEERMHSLSMEQYAYTDAVTGLSNRRFCLKKINELIGHGEAFVICFIDMDQLKIVNDEFGHNEGDIYIENIAKTISSVFRRSDFVCRIGGDEFVVIMPSATERLGLTRMKEVDELVAICALEKPYGMSVSYGIIFAESGCNLSADELLSIADGRMYVHKAARKKSRAQRDRDGGSVL